MLSRLQHRGPDDHYQVSGPRFTLGATRLAIVDLEGGRQPLSNEASNVWAAQNGEIYNFPELRPELEQSGHLFRTSTDTEVIPHLYEEDGSDFVRRLNGMFALALWDDVRGVGLLARDRTGKKPLYYLETPSALYFASEIKALLALEGYSRELNPAAIHHYLSYKHVPAPLTAFRGIESLEPARALTWSPGSGASIERYWKLSWQPDPLWDGLDQQEIAGRLAATLKEGVRRRLMSDVPIGFYLSGGLDSSLTTALAAELCSGPIMTFTLVYDEASTTEGKEEDRHWARQVAQRYGTEHHEEVLTQVNFSEELPRILACFDQPFSGVVSAYFLARLISRHVKVALSADGADELFGSYLSHRLAPVISAFLQDGPSALDQDWFGDDPAFVRSIASTDQAAWRARLHVFSEQDKRELYTPEFLTAVADESSEQHLSRYFEQPTATDPANGILEAEFRGIFPDQVLAFVDRLSMAHSLETRTAFLDTDFVELAASLPGHLKLREGVTKAILKQAAEPWLPTKLIHRKKEGFVMPVNQWLMAGLGEFASETLAPERVARAGIVRPEAAGRLAQRLLSGETRLANRVLSLMGLQLWWEQYLGEQRVY